MGNNLTVTKTLWAMSLAVVFGAAGCNSSSPTDGPAGSTTSLSGTIDVDGSSTVYPILQAATEEFNALHRDVRITVAQSGTGGGFKKFLRGETDISNASRPIKDSEREEAAANGIEFIELPVAFDGLSIVVSKDNTSLNTITIDELRAIWKTDSSVKKWSDFRAGLPNTEIKLFGPTNDHGTFEYFCEAAIGEKNASRPDYEQCAEYNTLVQGVSQQDNALGYVGYAYYEQNKDKLRVLAVDGGKGPVIPSPETISNGTYSPLSRPLFIYVNKKSMEKPQVQAFVKFLLNDGRSVVSQTGYIELPTEAYRLVQERADAMKTGTVFSGIEPGLKIEDVLASQQDNQASAEAMTEGDGS